MKITSALFAFLGIILVIMIIFTTAIALSTPKSPPVMETIAVPFRIMDFKALPPVSLYSARDGAKLAYRSYPSANTIILDSGSVAGMTNR